MTFLGNNRRVQLEGARVVITGASSGIGRALAEEIATKGGCLVLAARRLLPLQDAEDAVAFVNPDSKPLAVRCDVQDRASVMNLLEKAIGHLGGIDILINNAGTCVYGAASRTTSDDVQSMIDVHVLGPYHAMQAVLPHMRERGSGLVVNVASTAALHGVPYLSGYGAAKAALITLSQSVRSELHGSGVRIMTVCPGYTDTRLFQREKKVGGARRPNGRYRPAEAVAASIVRAIEKGRRDVVLSVEGKLLYVIRSLWPALVEYVFDRMAERLREDYRYA